MKDNSVIQGDGERAPRHGDTPGVGMALPDARPDDDGRLGGSGGPGSPPGRGAGRQAGRTGRSRGRQLRWVLPLALLAVAFLAYSLPPYLALDPSRTRLPLHEGFGLHYPLLAAHIFFGSVALLTGCLQVWPWLRQNHPRVHRWSGRLYCWAGVFPAGVAVLVISPLSSTGFVSQVGNTMLALLWLPITVTAYRKARQRRFGEHRRWMLRSFALTLSIVINRLWVAVFLIALSPQLTTTFGGDQTALINAAAGASVWMSWVVNLLVVEWWLERRPARRPARAAAARATATP
jgi:hypothetical protein